MSQKEKKDAQKSNKGTSGRSTSSKGFSAEERAAMKARADELKAEARSSKNRAAGEKDVLARIAEMPESERVIATRLHEIITAHAPVLSPKTWYGMPAYAIDGKIVCFYQGAAKFGTRYGTLGFNDSALLDAGKMWPVAYALTEVGPAEEAQIIALLKKAVGTA